MGKYVSQVFSSIHGGLVPDATAYGKRALCLKVMCAKLFLLRRDGAVLVKNFLVQNLHSYTASAPGIQS